MSIFGAFNMISIGIFGKINSGKSTLFNGLADENLSIVSNIKGTTSDNIIKMVEIFGMGKVRLVDTAGFDDESQLANERLNAVKKAFDMCDLILIVSQKGIDEQDIKWFDLCKKQNKKCLFVINDYTCEDAKFNQDNVVLNVANKEQTQQLLNKIRCMFEEDKTNILQGLVKKNDIVFLVMPQDDGAPNGRLILPQSMVIKSLLDIGAIGVTVTPESFKQIYETFGQKASLVITDSSVFKKVYEIVGVATNITSFSTLFAKANGDINVFVQGANALDKLVNGDKILIMEACSHTTSHKDIGTVVIPNAIKKYCGNKQLFFDFLHGKDEPNDYSQYKLIVHCGGCVQSRAFMMSRVQKALDNNVPITNYGIILAKLNGILNKIVW